MQRILEPGEIQALDASALPRAVLPERATVFAARAQRLRELAQGPSIGGYLRLMAMLADAQHHALAALGEPAIDPASLKLAQQHGMPSSRPRRRPSRCPGAPCSRICSTVSKRPPRQRRPLLRSRPSSRGCGR